MTNKKKKVLIVTTILYSFIYLIWRIFFTLPMEYGIVSMVFAVILLLAELIGFGELTAHFIMMLDVKKPERPKGALENYPTVDVFVATYNEPVEILYKTINGCLNMNYPDKSKVQIYLCDDGRREEVAKLAAHLGVNYITRTDNKGAKAGNLNNALANSCGELIVTFDADMIPKSNFLEATVPYFCEGKKVGFVQSPQDFYNQDMYQHNLYAEKWIPNEQDMFYHVMELAKNRDNSVIYGGSNTVLSRKALEEVGGFVMDIITEDFATGMMIQEKGYQCYGIDDVLASGLAPQDMPNFVRQRRRWASGCIQTGNKYRALNRKSLTLSQRISYFTSVLYWYDNIKRMIYLINPLLFVLFGIVSVKISLWGMAFIWLPTYVLQNIAMGVITNGKRNVAWSNVYETTMAPFLFPTVMREIFGIKQTSFSVTEKKKKSTVKGGGLGMAKVHIILAVLCVYGIIAGSVIAITYREISMIFLIIWYIMNFYNLFMAILVIKGRSTRREEERFDIAVDCRVSNAKSINSNANKQGKKTAKNGIKAKTLDIGEGGCCIFVKKRPNFPVNSQVVLELTEGRYLAKMKAKVSYMQKMPDGFRIGFAFDKEQNEQDYRNMLHILYDRIMPKTSVVDKRVSRAWALWVNIRNRMFKRYRVNGEML